MTRAGLRQHLDTASDSLRRLARQPLASLMTLAVIAITLALPAGLHLVLASANQLSHHWAGSGSLSTFLRAEVRPAEAEQLRAKLQGQEAIEQVELLSQEQALSEFSLYSGFDEALGLLEENPLPMVLLVRPRADLAQPDGMAQLLGQLRQEPLIEHVVVDLEWVKRLAAITETARRALLLLSLLLGLTVLLVIGNTIRLEIRTRQDEIIVVKLVGGSDAFVRRPFIYTGFWYGLFGGLGAWLLVVFAGALLQGPITELARLYQSDYQLGLLNLSSLGLLLLLGPLLGVLGAWSASGRHLRALEPE
ncbi:MAG: ABC transporter permease [Gammaproteobacteria bacterium]|nr:ABC transporter permease [Gammaproteobacteria bacterium]